MKIPSLQGEIPSGKMENRVEATILPQV